MSDSNSWLRALAACCLAAALSGCIFGPNHSPPELKLPAEYSATQPATKTVDVARWWTSFNDPKLNDLIDRAVAANLDLRLATARVRETRAQRGVVNAGRFPTLDASGSYTRTRSSENAFDFNDAQGAGGQFAVPGETQDLFQAGFDAGWEIDLFGGVRRSVEAADADIAAAVEGRRDALVTLLAEVARNYIELRGYQRQVEIAESNLKAQQDTRDLTAARFEARLVSELDVARADAQVATTASEIPSLESARNQAVHRLSVLLAKSPEALLTELTTRQSFAIPTGLPNVPVGLPSDLLRRRADIRQAERELAASTARIGVATADLFPKFSLTGSLGLQSEEFKDLASSGSHFYSFGPSVSWPIFDAGRIRSNIRVQNARQEQAAIQYEQAVLTALEEVENALVAYGKENQRHEALTRAVAANRRSVTLVGQLYERGLSDFLDVLEAQRSLFASEDALVQSDRTISTNLVALYKALGGGWESEAALR